MRPPLLLFDMTLSTTSSAADSEGRVYTPPTVVSLGSINAVTAGPSSASELDTLFGGDGGFREPDTTS